ncbi:uncharacterized protein [Elaeis guineensis]|uniref:Uncharacterized protein LOC105046338 n=1 Tax=Elaeis guineensis var. tenera TaxID=51953 RepID=A0A6I9RH72_ELAGV|nr:uncharacterized protein LOC105046338 [Elaeis guineensis]
MKLDHRYHHHHVPCLHCHPYSYIRMVQHLIERCLLLHMTQDDCIKALAERAGILPIVTLTVWKELLKENRGFFQAYFQYATPRPFTYKSRQSVSKFDRRKNWRGARQD